MRGFCVYVCERQRRFERVFVKFKILIHVIRVMKYTVINVLL